MFGTGAEINIELRKDKCQTSSRPLSRRRLRAWENEREPIYDGRWFRETSTIELECPVQPTQWPLQMEMIYIVNVPKGN